MVSIWIQFVPHPSNIIEEILTAPINDQIWKRAIITNEELAKKTCKGKNTNPLAHEKKIATKHFNGSKLQLNKHYKCLVISNIIMNFE